jgi:hypothetical protein
VSGICSGTLCCSFACMLCNNTCGDIGSNMYTCMTHVVLVGLLGVPSSEGDSHILAPFA